MSTAREKHDQLPFQNSSKSLKIQIEVLMTESEPVVTLD